MTGNKATRIQRLGYRKPADVAEPAQLVLGDYVSAGRVAIITLNRPHADNAITTELAAQLIEILEMIAARSSVRVDIITGAGDRAFSVGGDLYQRKQMTKEEWLRQRQVFDRSGGRSAIAVNLLAQAGFKNVYNIIDSMEGDSVEDPDSVFQGQRLRNGWKNSGCPWTYKLTPDQMILPKP